MNTKGLLLLQIYNVNIAIDTENDEEILSFLKRDFQIFENNPPGKPDLTIRIYHKHYQAPKGVNYFGDDFILYEDTIAQCIKAHRRTTWITYEVSPILGSQIELYIPDKPAEQKGKDLIHSTEDRLLSLNFLYPWQNSLIDFFHGTFLGILQMRLIQNSAVLLHGAAIEKYSSGLLLTGIAQCGKSTITDRLVKKKHWRFLSEDYSIINYNHEIYSFPLQRRVYRKQLTASNYYKKDTNLIEMMLDQLNILLMKPLSMIGKESIRILSEAELFDPEEMIHKANLKAVIYLNRADHQELALTPISGNAMAHMCSNMMMAEMKNLTGFYDLISCYGIMKQKPNQINEIFMWMERLYQEIFKGRACYTLTIPYYTSLKSIEKNLHPIMVKLCKK